LVCFGHEKGVSICDRWRGMYEFSFTFIDILFEGGGERKKGKFYSFVYEVRVNVGKKGNLLYNLLVNSKT
jgi:hypothetical protein